MREGDDDDDEHDARRRPGLLQHSTTIITFVPRLRAYKLWIKVTTSSTHNILSPQFQTLKFGAKAMIITAGEKEEEEEEEEVT